MKIVVDFDKCQSSGACMDECPGVFEVRDDGFLYILDEEPPESLWEQVRAAAESCPTGAITLEE